MIGILWFSGNLAFGAVQEILLLIESVSITGIAEAAFHCLPCDSRQSMPASPAKNTTAIALAHGGM